MNEKTTKSDQIRRLAAEGMSVGEIARRLGIRYQHVYKVRHRGADTHRQVPDALIPLARPYLTAETLLTGGFVLSATWRANELGSLILEPKLPSVAGVYAFVKQGRAVYVGVATMGLAKRIYFYGKPGVSQKTSTRINAVLLSEIAAGNLIEVYTAIPPDFEWNGLPINSVAGLELGLIKKFDLPWNIRSAK